jgi:hypothetical protein
MTDKEIIKALKHCYEHKSCNDCVGCLGAEECILGVDPEGYVYPVIRRQQAEIKEYRRNIKQLTETLTGGNGLRMRVDNMIVYADDLEEWLEFCDKQKAEAIKEFAQRLKADINKTWYYELENDTHNARALERVDELVKEMVGDGK